MNMGPEGYDTPKNDFHQHSGVAQTRVLHGLMSRLNSMTSMICQSLECRKGQTNLLTENGDTFQSDDLSPEIAKNVSSRYANVDI